GPKDPLGVDEYFEEGGPPLIRAPEEIPRSRRQIDREDTYEPEAYDDEFDEKPARSWTALVGVAALALAFLIVAGAMFMLTRGNEIKISDRPRAIGSGDVKSVPPDVAKTESAKAEAAKTDAAKTEASKTEAAKAEAAKTEAAKAKADAAAKAEAAA